MGTNQDMTKRYFFIFHPFSSSVLKYEATKILLSGAQSALVQQNLVGDNDDDHNDAGSGSALDFLRKD